jgi:hypothetical protein
MVPMVHSIHFFSFSVCIHFFANSHPSLGVQRILWQTNVSSFYGYHSVCSGAWWLPLMWVFVVTETALMWVRHSILTFVMASCKSRKVAVTTFLAT